MTPTAGNFKNELLEKIRNNPKTTYGKKELELFIINLYAEFLERYID